MKDGFKRSPFQRRFDLSSDSKLFPFEKSIHAERVLCRLLVDYYVNDYIKCFGSAPISLSLHTYFSPCANCISMLSQIRNLEYDVGHDKQRIRQFFLSYDHLYSSETMKMLTNSNPLENKKKNDEAKEEKKPEKLASNYMNKKRKNEFSSQKGKKQKIQKSEKDEEQSENKSKNEFDEERLRQIETAYKNDTDDEEVEKRLANEKRIFEQPTKVEKMDFEKFGTNAEAVMALKRDLQGWTIV